MLARLHVSVSYFWGDLLLLKIVVYIFYSLARLYPYITVHHKLGFCARAPEIPLQNSTGKLLDSHHSEDFLIVSLALKVQRQKWLHCKHSV